MGAFKQLIISNFKDLKRDTIQLIWVIAFPLVVMLVFGFVTTKNTETKIFNIGLVSMQSGIVVENVKNLFKEVGGFNIYTGTEGEERAAFEKGERNAVIVVPQDSRELILKNGQVNIPIYCDNAPIYYSIAGILKSYKTGQNVLPSSIITRSEDGTGGFNSKLAIVLAITVMQINMFAVAKIIGLRQSGILKALGTTPLTKKVFFTSEVVFKIAQTFIQMIILLAVAYLVFKVKIEGNYLMFMMWILLGTATFVSFGYMLGNYIKNIEAANNIIQLITLVFILLSGLLIPISKFPKVLQGIVNILPINLLIDGLNKTILNAPFTYTTLGSLALLVLYFIILFIGATKFKWDV